MANTKRRTKKTSPFWRLFITAVGAALILLALSQAALFFFGTTAWADVSVRRQGGANDGAAPNLRYTWSVDYAFTDQNGKSHDGHTSRKGSDTSAGAVGDTVYYFTFAPFISALESDARPGLSQPLYIALGVLLIIVMNKKRKGKPPAAKKTVRPEDLTDYDDSVEEQFHDRQEKSIR